MNYKNINLTKVFYITGVIIIACIIATAFIIPMTTETPKPQSSTTDTQVQGDKTYVLTCEDDRIVAFVKGADRPYIETTTAVSSLPYDVQARLRAGIEFDSEEKLRQAINEYCS